MTAVSFIVPGRSQTAGSKRAYVRGGRAQVVDANKNLGAWKERIAIVAAAAMNGEPPFTEAVSLYVVFRFVRPPSHRTPKGKLKKGAPRYPFGRDLSKLVRAIEDGCNGIVWRDDALVVSQQAHKEYGDRDEAKVMIGLMGLP